VEDYLARIAMTLFLHGDNPRPEEQPDVPHCRHYTTGLEEAILADAFLLFRSRPERSAECAAILDAVATHLRGTDARRYARRVRLWFNDNAHAFPVDPPPSPILVRE
jgi:hypothetical protein